MAQCPEVDLRRPSGQRIRLAGTWTAYSGTRLYYFSQLGSCVWFAGGFETSATPESGRYGGLGEYTLVFSGTVATDFTLSGSWSAVRAVDCCMPYGNGTVVMRIDTTREALVLEQVAVTGSDYGALERLTQISDSAIPAP